MDRRPRRLAPAERLRLREFAQAAVGLIVVRLRDSELRRLGSSTSQALLRVVNLRRNEIAAFTDA